jgi:hypothetical protein
MHVYETYYLPPFFSCFALVTSSTTYPLPCGKHQIVNLDADAEGNYIALLSNGEV